MGALCGSTQNQLNQATDTLDNEETVTITRIEKKLNMDPFEIMLDRAMGMMIGAAIGDSIGSFCEFSLTRLTIEQLDSAMSMIGGGPHFIASGQVTDDTELAISLTLSLIDMKKGIFDINIIAKEYDNWLCSSPFDIGNCIYYCLSQGPNVEKMKNAAIKFNDDNKKKGGNQSNGSLMRIHPLIIYGHKLSIQELKDIVIQDSSLTHYNQYIFYCNIAYVVATRYLLINYNDIERNYNAFKLAEKWLRDEYDKNHDNKIVKEVLQWLLVCKKMSTALLHPATKHIGFIKIAFQRSFYNLWKSGDIINFQDAIKSTIFEGGDTDTNACIVGGIIGCWKGFNSIPSQYIDKIKHCKPVKDRDQYQPKLYFDNDLIFKLLKAAPTQLQ